MEPLVIDDEDEQDGQRLQHTPGAGEGEGAAAAGPAAGGDTGPGLHASAVPAAGAAGEADGWSAEDGMAWQPTPPSPVLGLVGPAGGNAAAAAPAAGEDLACETWQLGVPGKASPAAAAAAGAEEAEGQQPQQQMQELGTGAAAHGMELDPREDEVAGALRQGEQEEGVGEEEQPSHQLLFPESAGIIRWDASGQLRIAPPPPEFLPWPPAVAAAAVAAAAEGGLAERGDASLVVASPPTTAGTERRGQPPLLSEDGLHISWGGDSSAGLVIKLDDPQAHRWAFVAALGAQRVQHGEAAAAAAGCRPVRDVAPAAEGGEPESDALGRGADAAAGEWACCC